MARETVINVLVTTAGLRSSQLEIREDAYRHLFRARRLPVGQRLRLIDGEGGARWGRVDSVGAKKAVVVLEEASQSLVPDASVVVAVASVRPERTAWMIEKLTELGVEAVHLFSCERTQRRGADLRRDRLRRVAQAAAQQSGVARLPEIVTGDALAEVAERLQDRELVALVPGAEPLFRVAGALRRPALVVGPEGGFTATELELLRAAGARAAGLGESVLRTETAAVVAAGALLLDACAKTSDPADTLESNA